MEVRAGGMRVFSCQIPDQSAPPGVECLARGVLVLLLEGMGSRVWVGSWVGIGLKLESENLRLRATAREDTRPTSSHSLTGWGETLRLIWNLESGDWELLIRLVRTLAPPSGAGNWRLGTPSGVWMCAGVTFRDRMAGCGWRVGLGGGGFWGRMGMKWGSRVAVPGLGRFLAEVLLWGKMWVQHSND